MERKVSSRGQRRLGRHDFLSGAGRGCGRGLRGRQHGHRPCRQQRRFRIGTSRKADRHRLPIDSRDDRTGQGHHRRILRQCPEIIVFQRMLPGRQTSHHGGPEISRRLQRHHCGRFGMERHAYACGPGRVEPHRQQDSQRCDPFEQVSDDSQRGTGGLRRAGRRDGRRCRKPDALSIRLRDARL